MKYGLQQYKQQATAGLPTSPKTTQQSSLLFSSAKMMKVAHLTYFASLFLKEKDLL